MNDKKFNSIKPETVKSLFELMTAYQKSQVLFTFVELKIADFLGEKSLPAAEIAKPEKIDKLAMERFLNAAVMLGLLERKNGFFSNTEMTRDFLVGEKELYPGG